MKRRSTRKDTYRKQPVDERRREYYGEIHLGAVHRRSFLVGCNGITARYRGRVSQ